MFPSCFSPLQARCDRSFLLPLYRMLCVLTLTHPLFQYIHTALRLAFSVPGELSGPSLFSAVCFVGRFDLERNKHTRQEAPIRVAEAKTRARSPFARLSALPSDKEIYSAPMEFQINTTQARASHSLALSCPICSLAEDAVPPR